MSTITKRQGAGETPQPEDWLRLVRMIHGYRVTQMLAVAAKLGIADFLADGPKSVAELAERTETHPGALHRLLRALAGNGVFAEDDRGRYALTPLGGLLRTDDPGSARALAIYNGDELVWRSWGSLLHSVATGSAAFQRLYGMSIWEYRSQHPEPDAVLHPQQDHPRLGRRAGDDDPESLPPCHDRAGEASSGRGGDPGRQRAACREPSGSPHDGNVNEENSVIEARPV